MSDCEQLKEYYEAYALGALEAMNQPAPVVEREDGYVQDEASQWVAALVAGEPGRRVLDLCAAPGGKATAVASAYWPAAAKACSRIEPHCLGSSMW